MRWHDDDKFTYGNADVRLALHKACGNSGQQTTCVRHETHHMHVVTSMISGQGHPLQQCHPLPEFLKGWIQRQDPEDALINRAW